MNKTNVRQIIESLGGSRTVAVVANVHQVTVERWARKNRIPKKYLAVLGMNGKQTASGK